MQMKRVPKGHRFPVSVISHAVWLYHRFNHSYRDVAEQLMYRGIDISHEAIRNWCYKFSSHFKTIIKKREYKVSDKWHLDEMTIRINGKYFILWRAVDSMGYELDVFLQKRRNKKSAIRFLSRLLGSYPIPRVVITDKLRSYKGLNNRVENAHQPTRRKEKCLIRFKSPQGVQNAISLMGKVRNIFSVNVGRYTNNSITQRAEFRKAKFIWNDAAQRLLAA